MAELIKVKANELEEFVIACFEKCGVRKDDARITADVLIESDRRGIASHGVARLKRYIDGLGEGIMIPDAEYEIIKETSTTLLISGSDGLGQPVSYHAMKLVIEKAKTNNVAFAAIRDSNHYGIAGYYAMMALSEGLIGISTTNTAPLVVPTFGKDEFMGTNPIAVAVPTGRERPFVLDMATSTVPRGKLEVYHREGKEMPDVWATDAEGRPTTDAAEVLKNLKERRGGGLLPLGGGREETGGHKGYGLGMLVEILTGILSGGDFGPNVYGRPGAPANVCHFLGAINVEAFIPREEFTTEMDNLIRTVRDSEKAEGQDKIFIHGEKEFLQADRHQEFVELTDTVVKNIKEVGATLEIEAKF